MQINNVFLIELGSGFGEPVIDPNILEIHEHVEAIVEQFIGDPIDNTTLDPLCHNPECKLLRKLSQ